MTTWEWYVSDHAEELHAGSRSRCTASTKSSSRRRGTGCLARALAAEMGFSDPPPEPTEGGATPFAPHRRLSHKQSLGPRRDAPPAQHAEGIWLLLEDRGEFVRGDALPDSASILFQDDDRTLARLAGGLVAAVALLGDLGRSALPTDIRLIGGAPTPKDRPWLSFAEAVRRMSTTDFPDWQVRGPRTCKCILDAIALQGYTPLQRHFWWRQIQGLSASDVGVDDHSFLSDILETAATTDGLNEGKLVVLRRRRGVLLPVVHPHVVASILPPAREARSLPAGLRQGLGVSSKARFNVSLSRCYPWDGAGRYE